MIRERVLKLLKLIVYFSGVVFLVMLIISFSTLPYWGIYNLAVSESKFSFKPEVIVIMGGAGVPSHTALMRTYHASVLSKTFPKSKIIIALPDDILSSTSDLKKMEQELRIRSVLAPVLFENEGRNTRAQALLIQKILDGELETRIVIVSSPEHMYRTIKCFKKIGFAHVGGYPAFEQDINQSLLFNSEELGGKSYVPELGDGSQLRYQFWNHLKYEIILLREYSAITYYKIQSWI